jgi:hypothetical protein
MLTVAITAGNVAFNVLAVLVPFPVRSLASSVAVLGIWVKG